MSEGRKTLAENRKARHDFFIEETYEAGISLCGTEVKSIRGGKANLKDSYAMVQNGEVLLFNMHVSPYEKGNIFNRDPLRVRKLLLNKKEISKIDSYISQKGYSLIPLALYLAHGLVKVDLAVAKGKKLYDKRDDIAKKDAEREVQKEFKSRNQY